ncbi:MAG: AraC family transcriptional regulator N-terminal domain-containing protein [Mycobacterium sp.]
MMSPPSLDLVVQQAPTAARLWFELSSRARREGANDGPWPGLTIYRFTRPTPPGWEGVECLSLGVIAQAGDAVAAVGDRRLRGQLAYAVIGSHRRLDCRILEASPHQPILGFVLEIDPQLVRSVWSSMRGRAVSVRPPDDDDDECLISTLDDELLNAVSRFLGSLSASGDRRVLTPLHVQEMVYRILQGEQRMRLLRLAAHQTEGSPVAAAVDYVAANLAEPLTVKILAKQVCLSPSAFSRVFRETTGHSPYQYVKETRLERARQLLDEGRPGVADVSRSVGYTSVSHFIKAFRSRFGATPGDYAIVGRFPGPSDVGSAW